jgi:hypothetical protein
MSGEADSAFNEWFHSEVGLQKNKKQNKEKGLNNEKSFKNLLSRVAAAPIVRVAILAVAPALAIPQQLPAQQPQQLPAQGPSVTVVNTSANPVPVVGTVSIGGAPTVNAQQSGSWNVGIAGNSTTNPLQVHDVDHAPRTAYAQTKKLTFNGPDRAILGNFDVPDGKRLVIESFSVFGKLPSGNKLVASSINAFQGGEQFGTQHYAPLFTGNTEETFEPGVFIVSSGKMHLEAIAGNGTVTVRLERDHIIGLSTIPPFSFEVDITGYLVDAAQ